MSLRRANAPTSAIQRYDRWSSDANVAAIAVRLATLPGDGPTGGFFHDAGPVPW